MEQINTIKITVEIDTNKTTHKKTFTLADEDSTTADLLDDARDYLHDVLEDM